MSVILDENDPNHPHYFFRKANGKWVKYNGVWYTPEEWKEYCNANNIKPQLEWYHDIFEVLKQAQIIITCNPTKEHLARYFAFVERILKYYHWQGYLGSRFKGPSWWDQQ